MKSSNRSNINKKLSVGINELIKHLQQKIKMTMLVNELDKTKKNFKKKTYI